QALLRRLQPKLTIGAIDDPLEAEADNVADRVMRMEDPADGLAQAPPAVSRKCAACEEENKLQAKLANTPLATGGAPERAAAAGAAPGITASPVKVFREDDPDVVPAGGPDATAATVGSRQGQSGQSDRSAGIPRRLADEVSGQSTAAKRLEVLEPPKAWAHPSEGDRARQRRYASGDTGRDLYPGDRRRAIDRNALRMARQA